MLEVKIDSLDQNGVTSQLCNSLRPSLDNNNTNRSNNSANSNGVIVLSLLFDIQQNIWV